jgi:preprotein translocase subunit SecD
MDETTLTRTLHQLAANPPLHPSPSADARRRAVRLRRRRRTAASGLVAVVALGVLGTLQLRIGQEQASSAGRTPAWLTSLTDPNNPNHATTGYLGLSRASGGQYLLYWQGKHLCFETQTAPDLIDSECASVTPSAAAPMTVANIGADAMFVSVAPDVAIVDVTRPDGTAEALSPYSAESFPFRVVVAQGKVMSLRAKDKHGKQMGVAVAGPEAPQIRRVVATFDCSDTSQTGFDLRLSVTDSPKACYGLAPVSMSFVPKSAQAVPGQSPGWLVEVTLDERDRIVFGRITQTVTAQVEPKNQLAIVLDGKLLSVVVIKQAILGGMFEITGGTTGFDQQQAGHLASQMRG